MTETAAAPLEEEEFSKIPSGWEFPEISPGWGWMLLVCYLIDGKRCRTVVGAAKNKP